MHISISDASHLAKYLSKGIFNKTGNRDVSISIGDKSFIGIEKKGHKYSLYIKYNDQKCDVQSGFNENVSMELMAQIIQTLIEQSDVLKNVTLNLEKTPLLPKESIAATATEDIQAAKPLAGFTPVGLPDENNMDMGAIPDDQFGASLPDSPGDFETYTSLDEEPPAQNVPPYPQSEDPESNESSGDDTDTADEEIAEQPMLQEDTLPETITEEEMEENEMNSTAETANERPTVESAIDAQGLLPVRIDNQRLAKESYISNMLGDSEDIQKKFSKAFKQLTERDRETAVEFYIKALYCLMALFDNDIDSVASATGIDKRDIVLAIYERQLFV